MVKCQICAVEQLTRLATYRTIPDMHIIHGSSVVSLRHSVNGDFCGHSRFVLWHENLTTFVSWTLAKSDSCVGDGGLALIL